MSNKKETRICPKCKEEIKYWATVCPHCRSKTTPPKIIGFIFLIIVILAIISLISNNLPSKEEYVNNNNNNNNDTETYKREVWNRIMVEPEHFTTLDILPMTDNNGTAYLSVMVSNKMDYPLPELGMKFDIFDTEGKKRAYAVGTNDLASFETWNFKCIIYTYSKQSETFDIGDIKLVDYNFKKIKEYIKID